MKLLLNYPIKYFLIITNKEKQQRFNPCCFCCYARYYKIAICATNGKKTTTNFLNHILEANGNSYISNVKQNGKLYPPLTSMMLDLASSLEFIKNDFQKDYFTMAFDENNLAGYFNAMRFDYLLLMIIYLIFLAFWNLEFLFFDLLLKALLLFFFVYLYFATF